MTAENIWNQIVEHHNKYFNVPEKKIQTVWESIFAELLGYSRLNDEIDRHRNVQIGASERVITDIIIKDNYCDWFIVELKQHNYSLSSEMEMQLFSYLNQLKIDLGIIICGKIYIYDYDYGKDNNEQSKIEIEFIADNPLGIKFVELFSKSTYSKDAVIEFISDLINIDKMHSEITKDLITQLLNNHFRSKYNPSVISSTIDNITLIIPKNYQSPNMFGGKYFNIGKESDVLLDDDPASNVLTKKGNPTTPQVEQYIGEKIEKARQAGDKSITIRAGTIQKEMNGKDMPATICRVMRKFMSSQDEVLYSPKSENSTKYEVKYYLNQ